MEILHGPAMLATLGGFLALLLGLLLLLLPLLIQELSRPRDSAWGAVVLLLGLVLVTSSDRLTGAPMLAVLCGGLLIGRLGSEVGQARWRALSEEERLQLGSAERWRRSLQQLGASLASLLQSALVLAEAGQVWLRERRSGQGRSHGKRWVRRDQEPGPSPQRPDGEASVGPISASGESSSVAIAAAASAGVAHPGEPPAANRDPSAVARAGAEDAAAGAEQDPPAVQPPAQGLDPSQQAEAASAAVAGAGDSSGALAAAGSPAASLAADRISPAARFASGEAAAAPGPDARPVEEPAAVEEPIRIRDFSEVDALLDQAAGGAEPLS
jgi:hypothetical protein